MSTHNIPFFNIKKKVTLNYSKFAALGFFQRTQTRVRNSRGKRPFSMRATFNFNSLLHSVLQV